jgi:organic hydroperoxide reductase OsmC/OhrA
MEALMESKKSYKVFRYSSDVSWQAGRRGVLRSPGKPDLEISSPPEFKGEAGLWTPEEMLVASVNACTLMTFVAYARHKGLEFLSYECEAEGTLENVEGKYRFTEIILHPHVQVKSPEAVELAREILASAHANCFVSNSLSSPVKMLPEISAG